MPRRDSLWFSFAGVRSDTMGVHVQRLPDIQISEERVSMVDIPGRDGSLWLSDRSYKDITMRADIEIGRNANVNAITAWLRGAGKLIISSMPDYYWQARVTKGFSLAAGIFAHGYYRTTIEFTAHPFRYEVGDPELEPFTEPGTFDGAGTMAARPNITIYGSGSITLIINDATVLVDDVDDHITLDCDAMMALKDGANVSPQVTIMSDDDSWPELVPGLNIIQWDGTVTQIVIRPRWRWR